MDTSDKTVLVTGATGRQGGAVLRHLLRDGWQVRALTRDANAERARALARLGAEVMQADLDDVAALERALDGVYGVFSMQSFEGGVEAEARRGKNLAYAAANASRVEHFVYSSVGGADRATGIAHFESKWRVEEYIRELGLPSTILRPVFFMENLTWTLQPSFDGTLRLALPPDRPLQMIAVDDIGAFAALALRQPERFGDRKGLGTELAGDEVTPLEMARLLGAALERPVRFEEVPLERLRASSLEMATMFDWFQREGYRADLGRLRALHPGLRRFAGWLEERLPRAPQPEAPL